MAYTPTICRADANTDSKEDSGEENVPGIRNTHT